MNEPLTQILTKLNEAQLLTFQEVQWDPSLAPKPWYKDDEFYEFHRFQGHGTNQCLTLRRVIQIFIDNGTLVFDDASQNPNVIL